MKNIPQGCLTIAEMKVGKCVFNCCLDESIVHTFQMWSGGLLHDVERVALKAQSPNLVDGEHLCWTSLNVDNDTDLIVVFMTNFNLDSRIQRTVM